MKGMVVTRELKDGTKRYDAIWRANGRQRQRTFRRQKEAEKHLADMVKKIHDGTYSLPEVRLPDVPVPKGILGNGAGYVYFMQAGNEGLIKLGWAVDPEARRRTLQTGSSERLRLVGVLPGTRTDEGNTQIRFRHAHKHAEWYAPTPDLLDYIEGLTREEG